MSRHKPADYCYQAWELVERAREVNPSDDSELVLQYVADILETLANGYGDITDNVMSPAIAHDLAKWAERQETLI